MNIRKKFSQWLFRPEYDRLRALTDEAINDWRMVPYYNARNKEDLLEQLGEIDSTYVDFIMRQLQYVQIGSDSNATESFRISVVKESRSLYLTDPLTQFAIELWTDFAFAEHPNLTTKDQAAQVVWDEFFTATRNVSVFGERKLHKLSEDELKDGELFFAVFASTADGQSTCRTIPTEEIKEIIYDPDDKGVPLWYRRDYAGSDSQPAVLYYPDWAATDDQLARAKLPSDAKKANEVNPGGVDGPGTDVVVLHAAFREVNGRGWPLATASLDWNRVYDGFLKDRAAVARAAASVVEKVKVKGGQRAVDAIRARLGSSLQNSSDTFERNPPPPAGSIGVENESAIREWMNRPTNSADAEKDGNALLTQTGLGYKMFPHWFGRGESFRLATATAMEMPLLKSFNRYANFWSSVWRDLYKIVIGFADEYGSVSFTDDAQTVVISSDRIINLAGEEIAQAAAALGDLFDRALIPASTAQAAGASLLRTALENMGIQVVDELLTQTKEAGESHAPFRGS